MAESKAPEHRLFHPTTPASLQDFAFTSVALYACSFNQYLRRDIELIPSTAHQSCCEAILKKLPPSFEQIFQNRLQSVEVKLRSAFQYLIKFKICDLTTSRYSGICECFTYGADATVSYEASGKNLLNCGCLREKEKYMIACQCCFEEDIRRLWPLVSSDGEINEHDIRRFPLLRYWAGRMKCTRNEFLSHRDIIERVGFEEGGSWSALVYMWSKSTVEEQLSDINIILRGDESYSSYIEHPLSKLNLVQLNHVLMQSQPNRMIISLSYNPLHLHSLLQFWHCYKVIITHEQFSGLVKSLFGRVFKCSQRIVWMTNEPFYIAHAKPRCEKCAHQRRALYEIWTTATLASRSAFVDFEAEELLATTMEFDVETLIECHSHDASFFHGLLADMSFEKRSSIWLKYWTVVLMRTRPKVLDDLLKLCLNDEDRKQFIENDLTNFNKVSKFMEYLLIQQEYDDVIDYANLCKSNESIGREFRLKIIEMLIKSFAKEMFKFGAIIALPDFVNRLSVFPDEPEHYMKSIFGSSQFQTSAQEKCGIKLTKDISWKHYLFCHQWPKYLLNPETELDSELSTSRWKEFWSWCKIEPDEGNSSLSSFKAYLSVDEIFVEMVVQAAKSWAGRLGGLKRKRNVDASSSRRNLTVFDRVDEFLVWYFGDETAARGYKTTFMANFNNWSKLAAVFEGKSESVNNDVLKWCSNEHIG